MEPRFAPMLRHNRAAAFGSPQTTPREQSLRVTLGIESWKPVIAALVLPPVPFLVLILIGARLLLPRRGLGWLVIVISVALLWLSACTGAARGLSQLILPCAGGAQLRPRPRAARRDGGEEAARDRHPRRRHRAVRARVRRQQPAVTRRSSGCATASGSPRQTGAPMAFSGGTGWAQADSTAEARVAAKIAAEEFGRPIKWIEERLARHARERGADDGAAQAGRHQPRRPGHPRLPHGARPARLQRGGGARRPDRGRADGAGPTTRDAGARLDAELGRLSRSARHPARAGRGVAGARARRTARETATVGAAASHSTTVPSARAPSRTTATTGRCACCGASIPEGGVCHSVLVHPPGGIVGGDELAIEVTLEAGTHALITTPGATRFYRSSGAPAEQSTVIEAADGSRVEWLPLETIAYSGCEATNRSSCRLAPGAEMIGWDAPRSACRPPTAPSTPAASRSRSSCRAAGSSAARSAPTTRACSTRRSAGPAGACWRRCGSPPAQRRRRSTRRALLTAARNVAPALTPRPDAGATAPQDGVVVVRALAERVEPAMDLLQRIWRAWRPLAWDLEASLPRVWST